MFAFEIVKVANQRKKFNLTYFPNKSFTLDTNVWKSLALTVGKIVA